jgi:insulysin
VLTALLCEVFTDAVTEDVYDAELAELYFRVYAAGDYIGITTRGFSDKLMVLAERMLSRLVEVKVDQERFKEIVDQVSSCLVRENMELMR